MWILPQPDVDDVEAQLTRALTYANGAPIYALSDVERAAVLAVYQAYDALGGQPDVSLMPAALAGCRQYIRNAYNEVQLRGRLKELRAGLLASTNTCPYCGFGEPTELDHYLPKTVYEELAIYPRNLVPSCGPCNNAKRTSVPGVGPGLVHAYFQALPEAEFLKADVTFAADGSLDVTFRIDPTGIQPALAGSLSHQLDRLKLNERYAKQVNKFLSEQRTAILMFNEMAEGQLSNYLGRSATALGQTFGINDWRPALLRALAADDGFCAEPQRYLGAHADAEEIAA